MTLFGVAYRLGRTIEDVATMPFDEYVHWVAFLRIITPKGKKNGR